jgi:hypothetical protein
MNNLKICQKSLKKYRDEYKTVVLALSFNLPKEIVEMIWMYCFDVSEYTTQYCIVKSFYKYFKKNDEYWNTKNREFIDRAFGEFVVVDDLSTIRDEIGVDEYESMMTSKEVFYGGIAVEKQWIYHRETKLLLMVGNHNLKNFLKARLTICSKCFKKILIHEKIIKKGKKKTTYISDSATCEDCKEEPTSRIQTERKKNGDGDEYEISYEHEPFVQNLFIDEDILRCLGCGIELTEEQSKYGQKCKPCNLKGKTKQCRKNGCAKLIIKKYEFCYKHAKG